MRISPTTKGKHPALSDQRPAFISGLVEPVRAWLFDSMSDSEIMKDSLGQWPYSVGPVNQNEFFQLDSSNTTWPRQVPSPVGYGWQLNHDSNINGTPLYSETSLGGTTTADIVSIMTSEDSTVGAWVRVDGDIISPTFYGTIWNFGGIDTDGTASENQLGGLWFTQITDDWGYLTFSYESGTGTDHTVQIQNYRMTMNRWHYVVVRRSNVVAGGVMDFDVFVDGQKIYQTTGVTTPTGGSNSIWTIGTRQSATALNWNYTLPVSLCGLYMWRNALTDAQINLDFERGILYDSFTSVDCQVLSNKSRSVPTLGPARFFNFTSSNGSNWVRSVNLSDGDEEKTISCSIEMVRQKSKVSLAPLVTQSVLSDLIPNAITLNYSPILNTSTARYIEVRMSRCPLGTVGNDYQWSSVFQGIVDDIDQGGQEKISVSLRDYGSLLINSMTETEYTYGSSTVPVFLESVIQSILDDNDDTVNPNPALFGSYPPLSLVTIGAPVWAVTENKRMREPVMSSIDSFAKQIGWNCRFRFIDSPSVNDWRIALYEPERYNSFSTTAAVSGLLDLPVATFPVSKGNLTSMSQGSITTERLRNVVRIAYPSSETSQAPIVLPAGATLEDSGLGGVDNEGNRTPAFITIRADQSVTDYGRRFMEVQEDSSSQIDTISEAASMATSALSDLSFPDLDSDLSCLNLFEVEIGDVAAVASNDVYNTAVQQWAVRSTSTNVGSSSSTSITVHGKPSLGFKSWGVIEARPGMGPPPILSPGGVLSGRDYTATVIGFNGTNSRTTSGSGGRFIQARNPEFSTFSFGLNNPPDGWEVNGAAAWPADIQSNTNSISGNRSIYIPNSGGIFGLAQTEDSYIPVDGELNQPYAFTVRWQRPAGASTTRLIAGINWYTADRQTLTGSSVVVFDPDVSTNGTWVTSKEVGIYPDNTAGDPRWARIILNRQTTASTDDIYIDSVSLQYQSDDCVFMRGSNLGYQGGAAVGSWGLLRLNAPPLLGSYDYGNLYFDDTASPVPNNGVGATVRVPGVYLLTCQVTFACDTVVNFQKLTGSIRIVKNETYDAVQNPSGVGTTLFQGQPVQGLDATEINLSWVGAPTYDFYGISTVSGSVYLEEGDRITAEFNSRRVISTGDDVSIFTVGTVDVRSATFLKAKLQSAD